MQVQMLMAPPAAPGAPAPKLPGPLAVLGGVVRATGVRGLWLGEPESLQLSSDARVVLPVDFVQRLRQTDPSRRTLDKYARLR